MLYTLYSHIDPTKVNITVNIKSPRVIYMGVSSSVCGLGVDTFVVGEGDAFVVGGGDDDDDVDDVAVKSMLGE